MEFNAFSRQNAEVVLEIIEKALSFQELTPAEAQYSMNMIMSGKVSDSQLAAFLISLRKDICCIFYTCFNNTDEGCCRDEIL